MPQRKYYGESVKIARKIQYYKQVQKYLRDKWLELDIKLNAAEKLLQSKK
jgi:hypothetical protein